MLGHVVAELTRQIQMVILGHVVAELTRQIQKMAVVGHVVAESCTTSCSWSEH